MLVFEMRTVLGREPRQANKQECSANSSSTADTPPTKSPIGFLNTRQETESGGTRPLSPGGPDKSGNAPLRLCRTRARGASQKSRPRSQLDLAMFRGISDARYRLHRSDASVTENRISSHFFQRTGRLSRNSAYLWCKRGSWTRRTTRRPKIWP